MSHHDRYPFVFGYNLSVIRVRELQIAERSLFTAEFFASHVVAANLEKNKLSRS